MLILSTLFLTTSIFNINNLYIKKNNIKDYSFLCNYKKTYLVQNSSIDIKLNSFYKEIYKKNKICKTKDCYLINIQYGINYILNYNNTFLLNNENVKDMENVYKIFKYLNDNNKTDIIKYRPIFLKYFKKTVFYKKYYSIKGENKETIKNETDKIRINNNTNLNKYKKLQIGDENIFKQLNIKCNYINLILGHKEIKYKLNKDIIIHIDNIKELNSDKNNINNKYICFSDKKKCILYKNYKFTGDKISIGKIKDIYKQIYFTGDEKKFGLLYTGNLKNYYLIQYFKKSFIKNIPNIKKNKDYLDIKYMVKVYKILNSIDNKKFIHYQNKLLKNIYIIDLLKLLYYFDNQNNQNNQKIPENNQNKIIKDKKQHTSTISIQKKNDINKVNKKVNISNNNNNNTKKTKNNGKELNHILLIILGILFFVIILIGIIVYFIKKRIDEY